MIVIYLILVSNIEFLIRALSIFSERLAYQASLTFYYGDTNGRETLWEVAILQISFDPIWGYYPKLIYTTMGSWFFGYHPHNIYLESLMTMGLIGSIPFFLYLIYTLVKKVYYFIVVDSPNRFFALLFIAELVHGCFSGTLYNSWIWPCLFVFAAQKVSTKLPVSRRKQSFYRHRTTYTSKIQIQL